MSIPTGFLARGTLQHYEPSQVWNLHEIDNPGFLLPNGLDHADVNGDGYLDYVTNYEWDGKIRIAFYPSSGEIRNPWPSITVGEVENAENAAFGDFDDDGNVDIVVAHGEEFNAQSGVFIIWGPDSNYADNPNLWTQGLDIDESINKGQFHYIKSHKINNDTCDDIVVGGRGLNPKAGLKWIESPSNISERRDPTKWKVHNIDSDLESGHGFTFGDIDLDGDDDISVCNSDWDTPKNAQKIVWYENLGSNNSDLRDEWEKHIIYNESDFYTKEQVILHDFSGDGYPELLIQTFSYVYIFKNPQIDDAQWNLTKILKPAETRWRCRPINIGDFNNDNKTDILGMLIHYEGVLPSTKAAVFWMEYSGENYENATWTTHVIKWGDDFVGIGTYNGEKWDQSNIIDLDNDGDMDIVANCEEFNTLGFVYLSVLWFENPLF